MKTILLPKTPSIEEVLTEGFSYPEYIKGKEKIAISDIYKTSKTYNDVVKQIFFLDYLDKAIELQKAYEKNKLDITERLKKIAIEKAIFILDVDTMDLENNYKSLKVKMDTFKKIPKTMDDLENRLELQKLKLKKKSTSIARAKDYMNGKISVGDLKPEDIQYINIKYRKNVDDARKIIGMANKDNLDIYDLTFKEQYEFLKTRGYISGGKK